MPPTRVRCRVPRVSPCCLLHQPGACAHLYFQAANFAEPSGNKTASSILANNVETQEAGVEVFTGCWDWVELTSRFVFRLKELKAFEKLLYPPQVRLGGLQ